MHITFYDHPILRLSKLNVFPIWYIPIFTKIYQYGKIFQFWSFSTQKVMCSTIKQAEKSATLVYFS